MPLFADGTGVGRCSARGFAVGKAIYGLLAIALFGGVMQAQEGVVLSRGEATVLLEPYAANIVRVSVSLRRADALAGPGYGVVAKASAGGWSKESGEQGMYFSRRAWWSPFAREDTEF